ncbi:MAG: hypothetical protein IJ326_12940 [Lachnospiraceae bacterium]|nr:hypothetical protein [Lachnospiraceae bacterium]
MKNQSKKLITIFAILLCTAIIVIAVGRKDNSIPLTTEAASELAIQELQKCVNGDVFETVEIVDKALGEVVETEEGFEFNLAVTLKSMPVAESGWDTYYMQGMCEYFGLVATQMKELSEAEIAETLKSTSYSHLADKAASTLVYYADQREFANTVESDNYYTLLVKVNDATNNIEVFHETDDLAGERYKSVNEYLIPDVEAMKTDGRDTIHELVTSWEENS